MVRARAGAPTGEPGYAPAGWVADFFGDELGAYKEEEQLSADVLLLGRVTYESFSGAWPEREGPFADKINTMTKYVVSTAAGFVDEVNLQIFPLILGSGARLYPESPEKLPLELVSSRAVDSGVLLQTYRV